MDSWLFFVGLASARGAWVMTYFSWPYWTVPSLLFAPFASVICMLIALRRGQSILSYGLLGALYSIAYLLPWIYLITRLSGRRMPRKVIMVGYVAIYVNGIAVSFGLFALAFLDYEGYGGETAWTLLTGLVLIVGASTWLLGIIHRWRTDPHRETKHSSKEYTHTPEDLVYLTPFLLTLVGQVMYAVLVSPIVRV